MVRVLVVVDDPGAPGDLCRSALTRAGAAAQRFAGRALVESVAADSDDAAELGASSVPTVAVDGLVLSVGKEAPAGHIMRAIELALEGD